MSSLKKLIKKKSRINNSPEDCPVRIKKDWKLSGTNLQIALKRKVNPGCYIRHTGFHNLVRGVANNMNVILWMDQTFVMNSAAHCWTLFFKTLFLKTFFSRLYRCLVCSMNIGFARFAVPDVHYTVLFMHSYHPDKSETLSCMLWNERHKSGGGRGLVKGQSE